VSTPSDYIAAYYVRDDLNNQLLIEDYRDSDLLTGVTNPFSSGTGLMVSEIYDGRGVKTLRLFPRHSTGSSLYIYYKADFQTATALTSGVSLSEWFKLPVKFKTLGNAYQVGSHGYNPQKAEVFHSLGDILTQSLRSLFQGGQTI
jgi:hypothetical protein